MPLIPNRATATVVPPADPRLTQIAQIRANVPDELKTIPNWVVWKLQDRGTGKPGKVPHNPLTRHPAKSNDSSTWATFDEAFDAYNQGGWDGISVALTDVSEQII